MFSGSFVKYKKINNFLYFKSFMWNSYLLRVDRISIWNVDLYAVILIESGLTSPQKGEKSVLQG